MHHPFYLEGHEFYKIGDTAIIAENPGNGREKRIFAGKKQEKYRLQPFLFLDKRESFLPGFTYIKLKIYFQHGPGECEYGNVSQNFWQDIQTGKTGKWILLHLVEKFNLLNFMFNNY